MEVTGINLHITLPFYPGTDSLFIHPCIYILKKLVCSLKKLVWLLQDLACNCISMKLH